MEGTNELSNPEQKKRDKLILQLKKILNGHFYIITLKNFAWIFFILGIICSFFVFVADKETVSLFSSVSSFPFAMWMVLYYDAETSFKLVQKIILFLVFILVSAIFLWSLKTASSWSSSNRPGKITIGLTFMGLFSGCFYIYKGFIMLFSLFKKIYKIVRDAILLIYNGKIPLVKGITAVLVATAAVVTPIATIISGILKLVSK